MSVVPYSVLPLWFSLVYNLCMRDRARGCFSLPSICKHLL